MKSIFTIAAMATMSFSLANASPVTGEPAPAFSAVTITGETISSESLQGKPVVMEWTNDGCPFVQKHYNAGNMQDTQQAATDQGAVWISVISSAPGKQGYVDAAQAQHLTDTRGAHPTHIVLDPEGTLGKLYAAKTTPHMFVLDADGKVAYQGAIDSKPTANAADIETAENYVTAALTNLANGEEVATKESKPYGCSVKY